MTPKNPPFAVSENLCKFYARAKFIPAADGGTRLASIQKMSLPVFGEGGLEVLHKFSPSHDSGEAADIITPEEGVAPPTAENIRRAERRAKAAAFDLILCNPDLDTFATFTYAPDGVGDRTSYEECYSVLRPWLSNRVQRQGLKYVICPERHKKGGIHFHIVANSAALTMARARNANTGRAMSHNGNPLFNVTDWKHGFTSAELIRGSDTDRDSVAKYIFKYMGKNAGARIGGRYFLHGGALALPTYAYANDPAEFADLDTATHTRSVENIAGYEGLFFREWTFI